MRIPHRELEWIRRDPRRALRLTGGGSQNSTNALWRAIKTYHEEGRLAAHDQLEAELASLGASRDVADRLETYIDSFVQQGNTAYALWQNANLDLGSQVTLGGRIDRLDVRRRGGYAAWLFALKPKPLRWRGRLCMPLLQLEVATSLGAPTDDVSVGFYWVSRNLYDYHTYTRAEIDIALGEARQLSRRIAELGSPAANEPRA